MRYKYLLCLFLVCSGYIHPLKAQVKDYWVEFKDKGASNPYSVNRPQEFLSARSLARRQRQHIPISSQDLPVTPAYLDSLRKTGAKVILTSRWLNAATVQLTDSNVLARIQRLSIVKTTSRVFRIGKRQAEGLQSNLLAVADGYSAGDYGTSFTQINMLSGDKLHAGGFRGKGMQIAVIDAGFYHADTLAAFSQLRRRGGILAKHDFVNPDDNMFEGDTHGMYVLSTITGFLPGKLIGTAPEADVYLLRSENDASESLEEEDAWVAAAEWADSAGADVISSSLGYSIFDDPATSHTYIDMDGHTTHISKVASMLASKGMILISSAGNSGNKIWHYITAPADAEDILTVGAVDKDRKLAAFSSRGPTYDGRVKPDVMAMGLHTVVAKTVDGETDEVSGTSLATPVISGLVSCLWQEFPAKSSYEIMDAVRRSCSLYNTPSDSLGNGIPDFSLAERLLSMDKAPATDFVTEVYPNPFVDFFTLSLYSTIDQQAEVFFIDALGRVLSSQEITAAANRLTKVSLGRTHLPQGIYFAVIKTSSGQTVKKLIRD